MQSRKDMIAVACETLNRLFSTNEDRLIKQVNNIFLKNLDYLCQNFINDVIIGCQENPESLKNLEFSLEFLFVP